MILAVTDEDERPVANGSRCSGPNGLDVALGGRGRGRRADRRSRSRRTGHRGGELRRDRRRDRPAAQRAGVFARDAGGRRGAARADGVHGPARSTSGGAGSSASRPTAGTIATERVLLTGGPTPACRRRAGRRPDPGRRGPPHGGRARAASGVRRSTRQPMVFDIGAGPVLAARGGRPAVRLERSGRGSRARPARSTGRSTSGCASAWPGSCRSPRDLGLRKIWAATIDYTPDHLPILGPAPATPTARRSTGVTVASPGGHGMMWGPGVARVAADLVAPRPDRRDRRHATWASTGSTPRAAAASRPTRSRCRSRSTRPTERLRPAERPMEMAKCTPRDPRAGSSAPGGAESRRNRLTVSR